MSRPLQLLSLLSRLGASSVSPSANTNCCRFVSKGPSRAWMAQRHVNRETNRPSRYREEVSDEEEDLEDVEDKLQALVDEGRKRQRTVKYHMLRRQMTPPGAPQRQLTCAAMEQIRYLKQEQPDEWTVERLAEGFSVSPDVIRRVLRSKFVASPQRRAKQDTKVMAGLGQQVLPSGAKDRQKLPGLSTAAALPAGSRDSAVVPVADQRLMLRGEGSGSLEKSHTPVTALPAQLRAGFNKDTSVIRSTEEDSSINTNATEEDSSINTNATEEEADEEEADDEESWDGQVMTEEELEEFMEMEKPALVMQVGKDFFDAEGNFLYRV